MIGWLVDRWWLYKNRAELERQCRNMAFNVATGIRLEKEMVEMFGTNWRKEAARKLLDGR